MKVFASAIEFTISIVCVTLTSTCARGTAYCEKYSQYAKMIVFPAQMPAGGDLRILLATRTMQSVRCAVFGRVTRAINPLHAYTIFDKIFYLLYLSLYNFTERDCVRDLEYLL